MEPLFVRSAAIVGRFERPCALAVLPSSIEDFRADEMEPLKRFRRVERGRVEVRCEGFEACKVDPKTGNFEGFLSGKCHWQRADSPSSSSLMVGDRLGGLNAASVFDGLQTTIYLETDLDNI